MYKQDLVLNKLQGFICNQPINFETENEDFFSFFAIFQYSILRPSCGTN